MLVMAGVLAGSDMEREEMGRGQMQMENTQLTGTCVMFEGIYSCCLTTVCVQGMATGICIEYCTLLMVLHTGSHQSSDELMTQ